MIPELVAAINLAFIFLIIQQIFFSLQLTELMKKIHQ